MTFNVTWTRGKVWLMAFLGAGSAAAYYLYNNPDALEKVVATMRSLYLLP